MSSYDLQFAARPNAAPPTIDAIGRWLSARPRWKVDEDGSEGEYENPLTGLDMNASLRADDDAPADRVPVVLWIRGLRAHNAIEEFADEIEAFVAAFDLLVIEDADENTKRSLDRAWLREQHEAFNRSLHQFYFGHQANDWDEVADRARLDEVLAWNRRRDALAESSGDAIFVPQILFFQRDDGVGTFVAWADGIAARVPQVDAIQTTRAFVPWSVIEKALAGAVRESDHWLVQGKAIAAVFAAIEQAEASPPPKLVAAREVLTRDIVAEYLLPSAERAPRRRALELVNEGRMASFRGLSEKEKLALFVEAADLVPGDFSTQLEAMQTAHDKDPAQAVRLAQRALALNPTYQFVALIGAVNAMYDAQYDAALGFADKVLALDATDRNPHLVKATVLTELGRGDEAVAAADAALAIETDAMAKNVKAFALAAAGRADEAQAVYTSALADLDASLADPDNAEDADLHERRAYALLGLGRAKDALAASKKALKIDEDNLLSWQSVGRASVALGKGADAVKALRKVLAKRPASTMAAFHLAQAHALEGDLQQRDAALEIASRSPLYAALAKTDATLTQAVAAAPKEPAPKKAAAKKATPKK